MYEVYDASNTMDSSKVRLGKSMVNAFIIVLVLAGGRLYVFVCICVLYDVCMCAM